MKNLRFPRWTSLPAGLLVFGLLACSSSTNSDHGKGGSSGFGGSAGSLGAGGAAQSRGGSSAGMGGTANSGGANGSGGFYGLGGAQGSGGLPGTGGAAGAATGGAGAGSGGSAGAKGTGGAAAGGAPGAGGSAALDGSAEAGGLGGATRDASPMDGSGSGGAAACPAGGAKPTEGKKTVMVGTTSRSYYLHVPTKYDGSKPAPLVVDFHGLGGSGTSEAGSNPYKAVIDPEGVVSAYPDGVSGTNGTGWNIGPCCTSVDDVAFAKALVQDVQTMACIDPKRVYAVGYSLGGGMVHVLACKAADVFAAVSPAASDLVKETVDTCKPARPITVFTFRGTADSAVPYAGGSMGSFTNIGAKPTFQKWADLDQCTGSPSAEDSNGCSTYAACAGSVQVTLCTKQGGGHDPGNASVSWPVLKKYTLP